MTIGRLAEMLDMSKSGVIGQFGSKEALQLETVELVFAAFRTRVWDKVKGLPPGLPRLLAACEAWVNYAADPGYPGGCLLTQVTYDYDARTRSVQVVRRCQRIERVGSHGYFRLTRLGQVRRASSQLATAPGEEVRDLSCRVDLIERHIGSKFDLGLSRVYPARYRSGLPTGSVSRRGFTPSPAIPGLTAAVRTRGPKSNGYPNRRI